MGCLLVMSGAMASCGGGGEGGGGASPPPSGNPPPPAPSPVSGTGPFIVVDQFGYLTNQQKIAVLRNPVTGFDNADAFTPGATLRVVNTATSAVAFTGTATVWNNGAVDASSGDRAWLLDFSSVTAPGSYEVLDVDRNIRSARFDIGDNVYRPVLAQAVRTFFYQRAGHAKQAPFAAAGWVDGASHLGPLQDANARRYDAAQDASTERDLRGGWYDAGDCNKYTNWTASYVIGLLHAYTENPGVWTDDFDIPESGNGVPDLLDEVKWGVDHLARLQESNGSVLSIVGLACNSPPSSTTAPSLYGNASTSASLSAAAAFAQAARVFGALSNAGMNTYAAGLRTRAEDAWTWAAANPNVIFRNNEQAAGTADLGAGQQEVDDAGRETKRVMAAVYLFALTGDAAYRNVVDANYTRAPMFASSWLSPFSAEWSQTLLYYASLPAATTGVAAAIEDRYVSLWDGADGWGAVTSRRDPYGAFITDYTWGSNSVKALAGGMFVDQATYALGSRPAADKFNAGAAYLHYLHGTNPLGKVYLSNMGAFGAENSVDQFYHSWFAHGSAQWDSVSSSTFGPPPGFVTGGPNPSYTWDDRCPGVSPSCGSALLSPPAGQPPQKAYRDFNDSWPLNSWSVTENSNGYQTNYIRLLARYVN